MGQHRQRDQAGGGERPMITTIITLLIYICVLALVVYLVIWVLEVVGIALPQKVIQILWVIVALIALLFIVQALLGGGLPKLGKLSDERTIAQKLAVPDIMVPERR